MDIHSVADAKSRESCFRATLNLIKIKGATETILGPRSYYNERDLKVKSGLMSQYPTAPQWGSASVRNEGGYNPTLPVTAVKGGSMKER